MPHHQPSRRPPSSLLPAALAPPDPHGLVLSRSGVVLVAYRDRFDWQVAREHCQVVVSYLATHDTSDLDEFDGVTVAGHELMAEPGEIDRWLAGTGGGSR
jgi:hypothetical protein